MLWQSDLAMGIEIRVRCYKIGVNDLINMDMGGLNSTGAPQSQKGSSKELRAPEGSITEA
jgi:hypothetical protein